jgi:hypothetical protein
VIEERYDIASCGSEAEASQRLQVSPRRRADEANSRQGFGELDRCGRRVGTSDDQFDFLADALRGRSGKVREESMALASRCDDDA